MQFVVRKKIVLKKAGFWIDFLKKKTLNLARIKINFVA